jgi:putative ABC transport system permease protein
MASVFDELWRNSRGFLGRSRLSIRTFGRLPWVAVREWAEFVGLMPVHGSNPNRRGWGMSSWAGNLRLALRTLRKSPAFAATTVTLLGLGIGSVTAIFTVVDHVFLRALPYPAQDRLVVVENGSHPGPVWRELQNLESVEHWGASWPETGNLVGEGDPLRITLTGVSEEFLSLFGARPSYGRLLVAEDFDASNVAVLDYDFWKSVFGGDPRVMGRVIQVETENHRLSLQVVGVLNEDFVVPEGVVGTAQSPEIWRPMEWNQPGLQIASMYVLDIMGRMKEGVTLTEVNGELGRAAENLARAWPEDRVARDGTPLALPARPLQEATTRRYRMGLGLLLGAVALLLLVACVNVAHLFLARGLSRLREMAVRRALGARTGTLVHQLLVESLLLGVGGGLLGSALAWAGLRSFLTMNPEAIPWTTSVSLDLRALGFAALVSTVTVLLFGLIPALRSVRGDLATDMKSASRGSTSGRHSARLRNGLVVLEVALSLVLVVEAGLLIRSFMKVQSQDPGVQVVGVWTLPLTPSGLGSPEEYVQTMNEVEASLARVPGASSVTYSFTLPLERTGTGRCCWMTSSFRVEGEDKEGFRLFLQPVTATFFETLGVPLLAGRAWSQAEADVDPWPVVLAENLAIDLFGSAERAVNKVLEIRDEATPALVVGVAGDTRFFGLDQDYEQFVYVPIEKLPFTIPIAHMAVRTDRSPPEGWARMLREAVWNVAPSMPVPTIRTMEEWVDRSTATRRFDGVLFGSFGTLALILAAAGLYGTLLYTVGQRRREMGIRVALGAARARVQSQVVSQGLLLAIVGCSVGLGVAWGVGRWLESRLFGVSSTDSVTLLGTVAILMAAALLASWIPARRASRVDPMEVLREE